MPCRQIPHIPDTNLTRAELTEVLEGIVRHLSVKTEDLSSVKRSKISAPDERASSTAMGYFSLTFIGVALGTVLLLDLSKLVSDCTLAFGNVKGSMLKI